MPRVTRSGELDPEAAQRLQDAARRRQERMANFVSSHQIDWNAVDRVDDEASGYADMMSRSRAELDELMKAGERQRQAELARQKKGGRKL